MNTLRPVIPVSPVACFSWFPLHGPHSFPIHLQSPATCKVAHYPYAPYASQPTSQPGSQSVSQPARQTVSFGLLSQLFFSFRFCFLFSLLLFLTQIPTCLVACSALFLYAIVFVLTHKCSFIYIYVYMCMHIYIYICILYRQRHRLVVSQIFAFFEVDFWSPSERLLLPSQVLKLLPAPPAQKRPTPHQYADESLLN